MSAYRDKIIDYIETKLMVDQKDSIRKIVVQTQSSENLI